jgi:nucleotidyltransferase substrate binding protein (TIGR01987 family)
MTDLKGDIRWKQRFQNFEKAINLMRRTVGRVDPSEIERLAIIQVFEMSFELAWKLMKAYLESQAYSPKSPRETIKYAFQADLIKDAQLWLDALLDRNLTVHTYDEAFAIEMVDKIQNKYSFLVYDFYELMSQFNKKS